MDEAALRVASQLGAWRGVVTGLILRSLLTVAGYALGAFLAFGSVVVLTEVAFADQSWVRILYLPYVLVGIAVGVNLGLAKVLRREVRLVTERSTGMLGTLVDRAVGEMAIPEEGIATERLRALAELEGLVHVRGGRLSKALVGFAAARALEQAGFAALREQVLRVVREAEARGETVVSREGVREATKNGVALAFADQLEAGWKWNQGVARIWAALALVSLPVLALLFS